MQILKHMTMDNCHKSDKIERQGFEMYRKVRLFCSAVELTSRASKGVAIVVNQYWKPKIKSYKYVNEGIVTLTFKPY